MIILLVLICEMALKHKVDLGTVIFVCFYVNYKVMPSFQLLIHSEVCTYYKMKLL